MLDSIALILQFLNGIVILTSILFAVAQYFDRIHGSFFETKKEEIKNFHFPTHNRNAEEARKKWEYILNFDPIKLHIFPVLFYVTLTFIALSYLMVNVIPSKIVLFKNHGIVTILSVWIVLVSVLLGIMLHRMKRQRLTYRAEIDNIKVMYNICKDLPPKDPTNPIAGTF